MPENTTVPNCGYLPIPDLSVGDADIILLFLSSNGLPFLQRTTDDWYRATIPARQLMLRGWNGTIQSYHQDEPASPMACLEREQLCIAVTGQGRVCTPLGAAGNIPEKTEAILQDREQLNRVIWFYNVHTSPSQLLADVINSLHTGGLLARYSMSVNAQGILPDNQWQLEVRHWFATIMAGIQQSFVRTAVGPTPDLIPFATGPQSEQSKAMCNSQVSICDFLPCSFQALSMPAHMLPLNLEILRLG